METGDEKDASRQWRDLNLPFYGHQLVFTILRASFGQPDKHETASAVAQQNDSFR